VPWHTAILIRTLNPCPFSSFVLHGFKKHRTPYSLAFASCGFLCLSIHPFLFVFSGVHYFFRWHQKENYSCHPSVSSIVPPYSHSHTHKHTTLFLLFLLLPRPLHAPLLSTFSAKDANRSTNASGRATGSIHPHPPRHLAPSLGHVRSLLLIDAPCLSDMVSQDPLPNIVLSLCHPILLHGRRIPQDRIR